MIQNRAKHVNKTRTSERGLNLVTLQRLHGELPIPNHAGNDCGTTNLQAWVLSAVYVSLLPRG